MKEEEFEIDLCRECGKELDPEDEYHVLWGTCDAFCYGKMVGVY
jgi:hypothetical protein